MRCSKIRLIHRYLCMRTREQVKKECQLKENVFQNRQCETRKKKPEETFENRIKINKKEPEEEQAGKEREREGERNEKIICV